MTNLKKELVEGIDKIEITYLLEKYKKQAEILNDLLELLKPKLKEYVSEALDKYAEFVVREYIEKCKGCGRTRCDCGKTHNEPYSGFDAVE